MTLRPVPEHRQEEILLRRRFVNRDAWACAIDQRQRKWSIFAAFPAWRPD